MKIKNKRDKIRKLLALYPELRNCDIKLTIKFWQEYQPARITTSEKTGKQYVELDQLFFLEREDNIKRIRAKIQSPKSEGGEELYPPTDIKVAEKRKMNMDKWHQAMAFNR
jgi:hypothetical protein